MFAFWIRYSIIPLNLIDIKFSCLSSEREPPLALLKLYAIADKGDGWVRVISSMINVIPTNNPLGSSVVTLLLHDSPLPSKVQLHFCKRRCDVEAPL